MCDLFCSAGNGFARRQPKPALVMIKLPSVCGVLLAMLMLGSVLSCSSGDDTTAIRELINEGAKLSEKHDISGLVGLTSDDFVGLPGNLDRREARRILWAAFRHYGALKVLHPLPSVDIKPDLRSAAAVVPFLILRENASLPKLRELYEDPQKWLEQVGDHADLYRLKLELIKPDGRWFVKKALLERFTGISFEE